MKSTKLSLAIAAALAAVSLMLGGCTPKNVTYMQDLTTETTIKNAEQHSVRLQPGDKLSIIVHSKDPTLASLFNLPLINGSNYVQKDFSGTGTTNRTFSTNNGMSTYTIDEKGDIDFPVLGRIKLEGMSRSEVQGFIKGELIGRNLIKDPTVIVEFLNTGINILGQVNRPGRYDMNKDNITILEAITLAGDLAIGGRRDNVKIVRDMGDGTSKVFTVDLTKGQELISSPAYYLKQNDLIYVEPNSVVKRYTTVNGNTALQASFWVSVASLLTSVAVLIFK